MIFINCFIAFKKSGLIYAPLKPIIPQLTNPAQRLKPSPLGRFARIMDYDAWADGGCWTFIYRYVFAGIA